MMKSLVSQALLGKNLHPRKLAQLFKAYWQSLHQSQKTIFVFLTKQFTWTKHIFMSQETIGAYTGYSDKTVREATKVLVSLGLIIKERKGYNVTLDLRASHLYLRFLFTMRETFSDLYSLFTRTLMFQMGVFGSLFFGQFTGSLPPIKNNSITINTESKNSVNKRVSKSCCLIYCEDEECILPKERGVMDIERLRRGEFRVPSHMKLDQNHVTNDNKTHQRGNGHYVPGSVDTGRVVNTYVEYKGPEDIEAEEEKANHKYVNMDDKNKYWGKLLAFTINRNKDLKKEQR